MAGWPPARLPLTPSPSVAVFRGGFVEGAPTPKNGGQRRGRAFLGLGLGSGPLTLESEGAGEGSGRPFDSACGSVEPRRLVRLLIRGQYRRADGRIQMMRVRQRGLPLGVDGVGSGHWNNHRRLPHQRPRWPDCGSPPLRPPPGQGGSKKGMDGSQRKEKGPVRIEEPTAGFPWRPPYIGSSGKGLQTNLLPVVPPPTPCDPFLEGQRLAG